MIKKVAAVALLGLGLMGSAQADFTNPGFESGLSGWDMGGDVSVVSSFTFGAQTILAPEGSKMALLGSDASLNFNVLLQSVDASSQPLTLWYRFLGTGNDGVALEVQHATLTNASPTTIDTINYAGLNSFDTGWKKFTMGAGTTFIGFFHDTTLGDSKVLVDVSPVPEPGTYAMLLAGLGIMGSVVRRRSRAGQA